jgi:hypothetical protein
MNNALPVLAGGKDEQVEIPRHPGVTVECYGVTSNDDELNSPRE